MKVAYLLIMVILLLSLGCNNQETEDKANDRLKVVVTVMPQAEFVQSVGGDKVDVIVMIPTGASPHTYEPTPSQLRDVAESELYFKMGSGIEFETAWMDDIEGVSPKLEIVDCSRGIELIEMTEAHDEEGEEEHAHEGLDPHIWNSPKNARQIIENIYDALAEKDPDNRGYYRENAERYMEQLDLLDSSIEGLLEDKTNRKFIVFHPAWGYFANEYRLEQIAVEEAGKEPTAQNLQKVIDTAKEQSITVVFASPQYSISSANTIADEINGSVVLIDPLDKNYLENMKQIADAFATSMK